MDEILKQTDTVYQIFKKREFLFNPDEAEQKLIQTVAILALLNSANHARKSKMTQSAINLTTGVVLWANQEAFLHKALSENVASLSTENERLTNLLGQFEAIGMDLAKLSEEKKQQLKEQQEKFQDLIQSLLDLIEETNRRTEEINKQTEETNRRLAKNLEESALELKTARHIFTLAFQELTKKCKEGDLKQLKVAVDTLTMLCESALPKGETYAEC